MKTYTIKEALLDDSSTIPGFVYVVRDGEVIFYVGISQSPTLRICQHVGMADAHELYCSPQKFIEDMETKKTKSYRWTCSPVGSCILDNAPESLNWSFDVYEKADAIEVIKRIGYAKIFPNLLPMMEHGWYDQRQLVENALIDELKPCFNRMGNNHPSAVPDRYIHDSGITNEGVILES